MSQFLQKGVAKGVFEWTHVPAGTIEVNFRGFWADTFK